MRTIIWYLALLSAVLKYPKETRFEQYVQEIPGKSRCCLFSEKETIPLCVDVILSAGKIEQYLLSYNLWSR